MSQILVDILIWILLFSGIGFGVLGFAGLVIFPDITSRMFTASRASLISVTLVALAVMLFGTSGLLDGRGYLYAVLVTFTVFLLFILFVANMVVSRIIRDQIPSCAINTENGACEKSPSGNSG